jgi:methionyl-tRNA formyltransferase
MDESVGYRSQDLLEWLWANLDAGSAPAGEVWNLLEGLLRNFETTLGVYETYGRDMRPLDRNASAHLGQWLRLGELFESAYRCNRDIRFLNASLKLVDCLIARREELAASDGARLAGRIEAEADMVRALAESVIAIRKGSAKSPKPAYEPHRSPPPRQRYELKDTLFLAARTARSQSYAQAMARAGLVPDRVLIYGPAGSGLLGQTKDPIERTAASPISLPDLDEPLDQTCAKAGWSTENFDGEDLNDAALLQRIGAIKPRLVVFSGYGGKLASRALLEIAPFLHAHAGWLPGYRGSTTLYYSWLIENSCAVTALLLAKELDAGPILLRRRYPPPANGVEVDYLYDSAIRADLLAEVLSSYARTGNLPASELPEPGIGRMYFIIHPLLRHLARSSDAEIARWGTFENPLRSSIPHLRNA